MSLAATSKSAAACIAGLTVLTGWAGGASARSTGLCTTTVSAPTVSPSAATAGTPVTYTATVTAPAGCANGTPVGTVSFFSDYLVDGQPASFQIGSAVALQQGTATLVDNSLPAGSFTITASYTSGDQALFYDSGPSAGTSLVIATNALHRTVMAFTLTPSTLVAGQFVTLHVQVIAVGVGGTVTGTVPTGTVSFSAGPTAGSGQVIFAAKTLDGTGSIDFAYAGFVPGDYIIIASYTGDPTDQGISGQRPLTVMPATNPVATATTVSADPGSITAGQSTTLRAHVVQTATQTPPPAGGTVDFFAGPDATSLQLEGTGALDANGDTQLTVSNFTAGSYVVRAQYLGDSSNASAPVLGSSGDGALLVGGGSGGGSQRPTQVAYTGAATAAFGAQLTLTGRLTQGAGGTALAGEPLTLALGSQSCVTGVTDGSGDASCTLTVSQDAAQVPVAARFLGDANWAASSASSTFTVTSIPTATAYTGDTQDAAGSSATLSATVVPAPDGGTVTFTLGTQSCSATAAGGTASCTIALSQPAGSYTVDVAYGGNSGYAASSASAPFTIVASATATHISPIPPVLAGSRTKLSATVSPPAATGTVTFSSGTTTLCTATLAGGTASCQTSFAQAGSYTVTARYAGSYPSSSDSAAALVYAFAPGGGSFVVGDRSDTGSVTFWSARWAKVDALSGGPAPSSFKGFASSPSAPACGTSWSTGPGASAWPPAGPLPAYMAVIVASAAGKSGPQISGDTVALVIVRVAPGYASDPGHAGTGTVVATLCTGGSSTSPRPTTLTYTGATQRSAGSPATLSSKSRPTTRR